MYSDKETLSDTTIGGITLDSMPLFADASIVRANAGIGKSFRSRFSLAPIAETDVVDGTFSTSRQTAWNAALATFNDLFANGGSDTPAGSGVSHACAVSQKVAFQGVSPFVTSDGWTFAVQNYRLHPYMGSQTKRKPRRLG
jgi:hypothetical protein